MNSAKENLEKFQKELVELCLKYNVCIVADNHGMIMADAQANDAQGYIVDFECISGNGVKEMEVG